MDRSTVVAVLDVVSDWTTHDGPLYRRLATALRRAIARGDLPPGTILPAERHMARALAVGRSTVVGAYDLLRSEGVIISRQGSGTWVSGAGRDPSTRTHQAALRRAALSADDAVVDLATASLPAAPEVAEVIGSLRRDLTDPLLEQVGYSPAGLPALRRAIANMFTADGLPTTPEQILVTTGDQQALFLLTQQVLTAGDGVLVEDPTSPGMLDLVRELPVVLRHCRSFSTTGAGVVLDAIRGSEPALVYLITSLGPEGLIADPDELRRLARGLRDFTGSLIEDASSRHLLRTEVPLLAALAPQASVFTVGSMSKLFWSGLRVGWIHGDENAILRLARAKARVDLGTPLLSQLVSAVLLNRIADVGAARRVEIADRSTAAREVLRHALPEFEVGPAHGAITLWVRMPHGASRPFAELARRRGVAIVPGDSLSPDGLSDRYFRLAIGPRADVFADGVARLARAWDDYRIAKGRMATDVGAPDRLTTTYQFRAIGSGHAPRRG
ncbi:PLP-dependent aminotransferase family protein [Sphaerisporangium sp. NPDC051011]|uniref:aminotransferase-like domain-containing protein n=1 Tax=Sphaerisporangium sp. NPDC051011 TaxID=3155792 RepID=UPI0033D7C7B0